MNENKLKIYTKSCLGMKKIYTNSRIKRNNTL